MELLSPSQKFGVIPQKLLEKLTGQNVVKLHDDVNLAFLKTVHYGDFCISLRSFQGGFEYSKYEGVVSPAYQIFYSDKELCNEYYKYLFKTQAFISKINSYTISLRDGKPINYTDFGNTLIPIPPVRTQQAIADYLDRQCGVIDGLVEDVNKELDEAKYYLDVFSFGKEEDIKLLLKDSVKNKKEITPSYLPYYINYQNTTYYFGHNALENDYLTFTYAKSNHTYFHASKYHGAHVVVNSNQLNEDVIRKAANIAAYNSKGRYSSSVPVDYCSVKDVKKVKGAKLGFVTIRNQKTIYIDPEEIDLQIKSI